MIDVLVVGDANPDLVLRGDIVPRFGQAEQLLDAADLVLGGSAAITAQGLATLGRAARLCALTGNDAFGEAVHSLLRAGGVDITAVVRDRELATGVTVVLSKGRERAILTYSGAISALSYEQVCAALVRAAEDGARHLHVSSFFLLPALTDRLGEVFDRAHALDMSTSLDPNYDPVEQWDGVGSVLSKVDVLLPNRVEALALARRLHDRPFADPALAGQALAAHGPVVVIKDGANGALQVNPDGSVLYDKGIAVDAIDSVGAGDTFNAGYLDSLLRGLPAAQCLRRAAVAGALSTEAVGGTAAQPTLARLLDVALIAPTDRAPAEDDDVARQR